MKSEHHLNDEDLHNTLRALREARPALPARQAQLRALLLHEHTFQQAHTSRRWTAFKQQVSKGYLMKVKKRASFASPLAVMIVLSATATASAAAVWFGTSVSDSIHGHTVIVSSTNCPSIPASQTKALQVQLPDRYSFDAKYQIVDSSKITSHQIKDAALAMCEQRAIAAKINKQFPDMQEFSARTLAPNSKGLYFPIYLSGTVTTVQGQQITVDALSSNSASAASATMQLADDALLLKNGVRVTHLQPGETIYFAYQNHVQVGVTPNHNSLASLKQITDPGSLSVIRGVGVMGTNSQAIQRLQDAITSGAVKVLQSDPRQG